MVCEIMSAPSIRIIYTFFKIKANSTTLKKYDSLQRQRTSSLFLYVINKVWPRPIPAAPARTETVRFGRELSLRGLG